MGLVGVVYTFVCVTSIWNMGIQVVSGYSISVWTKQYAFYLRSWGLDYSALFGMDTTTNYTSEHAQRSMFGNLSESKRIESTMEISTFME